MNVLIALIVVFAFSIVFFSFFRPGIAVSLYIIFLILVPYIRFQIGFFPITENLIIILMLAGFIYRHQMKQRNTVNIQFLKPFLFLYISLIFLGLFTEMALQTQFNYWRVSIVHTCIVPVILWNIAIEEPKVLEYIKRALIISLLIAGIYGIFLIRMGGYNPYISVVSNYFNITDFSNYYIETESRINFSNAGKIQSTMIHPMLWALILCFSIVVFLSEFLKTGRKIYWLMIGFLGFNILITGVRTAIAAALIGFAYYAIRNMSFKVLISVILIVLFSTVIVSANSDLSNLFNSFVDFSGRSSSIEGSSITMRLNQFGGALKEIKGSELVGKGYGWTTYYMSIYESHPILLDFESLIFVALCNSGYIGLIFWSGFFLGLFRLNRKFLYKRNHIYLMDTLILIYLTYAIGTGEYGYLPFFAIFYCYLLCSLIQEDELQSSVTETIDGDFTPMENKKINQLYG